MLGDERDEDSDIPSIFQNSPYYNNNEFVEVLRDKKHLFSLITLNCQSLNAKYNELCLLLQDIEELSNCPIDAICLQETWLGEHSDTSLLNIPGYNLISKGKSCSTHGGVAIYLSTDYDFQILSYHSRSNIWDGLFVEIERKSVDVTQNSKKMIIGNIYRPPRNNVNNYHTFTDELNEIMVNLQCLRQDVALVGDFNLDLLKIQSNDHIKDYFDTVLQARRYPCFSHGSR
jgi:exonuclease III